MLTTIPAGFMASGNPALAAIGTAINVLKAGESAFMMTREKSDGTMTDNFQVYGPEVPIKGKDVAKPYVDYSEKHPRANTRPRSERTSGSS